MNEREYDALEQQTISSIADLGVRLHDLLELPVPLSGTMEQMKQRLEREIDEARGRLRALRERRLERVQAERGEWWRAPTRRN